MLHTPAAGCGVELGKTFRGELQINRSEYLKTKLCFCEKSISFFFSLFEVKSQTSVCHGFFGETEKKCAASEVDNHPERRDPPVISLSHSCLAENYLWIVKTKQKKTKEGIILG